MKDYLYIHISKEMHAWCEISMDIPMIIMISMILPENRPADLWTGSQ